MDKLKEVIAKDEPSENDVSFVDSIMSDIESKERELKDAWHVAHGLLTAPNDVRLLTEEENNMRKQIYETRAKGQEFVSAHRRSVSHISRRCSLLSSPVKLETLHGSKRSMRQ